MEGAKLWEEAAGRRYLRKLVPFSGYIGITIFIILISVFKVASLFIRYTCHTVDILPGKGMNRRNG